ncbi:hypothetical protein YC2023_052407 [Brassica napus]
MLRCENHQTCIREKLLEQMLDFFIQTFQVKCLDGDALPIPVAKALTAAAAVSSSSF